MDELKSSAGAPPPNLPIVNPSTPPPPLLPKSVVPPSTAPLPPKSLVSPQVTQSIKLSQPTPPTAPPHTPPQPQGAVTLPRSSIRTMESDIKSAQSGQVPKGIEIKSSVLPAETKPITPPEPLKPALSPAMPPVGVKLGEAEKRTMSLPGQSIVKPTTKPPETKPVPPTISPATPAPLLRPAPVPPPSVTKPPQPLPEASVGAKALADKSAGKAVPPAGLAVPPKQSLFANKKILVGLAVVILALVGGFLYFSGSVDPEIVVTSPSPSPTVSTALTSQTSYSLSPIFGQSSSITILADSPDQFTDLQNEAVGKSNSLQVQNLLVSVRNEVVDYKFSSFLNKFNISFPANLSSAVDNNDFNLILTKQTEFFDQNGKVITSPSAEDLLKPKIALSVRVVDATEAQKQLNLWESEMDIDFADFYGLTSRTNPLSGIFSENTYRGTKIRYINYAYPDRAIDYAIVTAKNGNDYLIIANSRQQVYSIIDQLLGF